MTAYYNENDKFAAAWLRQLIAANLISSGDVDERSIEEITEKDLRGYTQCHFFAGIGVWSYALRAAGWPDDSPVWTGSCPCQSFSASGQRRGFSDKRHLWPAWFRLIGEFQPVVIFGEQVSSRDGLVWFDAVSADLENAGYAIGALDTCAASVGAPHIRNRLYFVAERERNRCEFLETPRLYGERTSGHDADRRQSAFDFMLADTELRRSESGQGTQRGIFLADANGAPSGVGRGAHGAREGQSAQGPTAESGRTFWSHARYVCCRDGKYRIFPAEPALQPLAPRTAGRVGMLRGAGNALCAPQAQAFIEAYLSLRM